MPAEDSYLDADYAMLAELQTTQPQLYETLTKVLNPNDQQIIQGVIAQADANAVQAQAVAAAQASQSVSLQQQQIMNGGPPH